MDITVDIGLVVIGIVLLNIGAQWLVDGSSQVAANLGVRPLLVGLTVVALGTSAPEFVVSLVAVITEDMDGMSIGNVIGSNIANIGLILGISALMAPLAVERKIIKHDLVILGIVTVLLMFIAGDEKVTQWEGCFLLLGGVFFFWHILHRAINEQRAQPVKNNVRKRVWAKNILYIVFGLGLLIGSSNWLIVDHSIPIMEWLGVSDAVIGLTIIAIGTSLPELAAAVASISKGQFEIGVGNVIGSNIINTLIVLGGVAAIREINAAMGMQLAVQFLMTLMLYPLFKLSGRLQTSTGGFLLIGYIVFIAWSFL
ncbi:MAG: sodium:calcium antiporter [Calditrichaeota bacterium]|nr:MAG: sodium:calcium antiporter [Calditrichota bacterium]